MIQIGEIQQIQWVGLCAAGFFIGMSKAGVKGTGLIMIPIMAELFGGKLSSGILLPMLSMGDICAVWYYNRHADWRYIWKLLPAAMVGVLFGIWIGDRIPDEAFKSLMGIFILGGLLYMAWREFGKKAAAIPAKWIPSTIFGMMGGITTMIGNAAGPIMNTYLLATNLPKNSFIGTGAWFFLVLNLFKIPFHVFIWKTISLQSFQVNAWMFPLIVVGMVIGVKIVRFIPEKEFRYFVMIATALVSLRLFV
ncbi:MAG: sulfite exporter TauE/SafE family protein [Bacteroidota bacterium]